MIPLNDFSRRWSELGPEVLAAVEQVGASGHYVLGPAVASFERGLAEACRVRTAVGVGNGLDALEICLRAAGCKAGDRVLTTPLSAFATTLAILRSGAIPCFSDVDENGLLDLDVAEGILRADDRIRFLLPVHLYGRSLDLRRLRGLVDVTKVTAIEDCAQAIGASSGADRVGTVGAASALSFYPTKNLGCLGDGGAVLTNDPALAVTARSLRDYGQSSKYVHDQIGLNSRLDELQAQILYRAFLPRLEAWTRRRRSIAEVYCGRIENPALGLPVGPVQDSVWHLFPMRVRRGQRQDLERFLAGRGVMTAIHYPILIPDQKACGDRCETKSGLSRARELAAQELSIPIHPYMLDAEVAQVVDACNAWRPT